MSSLVESARNLVEVPLRRWHTDDFHKLVHDLSDILGPTSGINSDDVDVQDLMNLMEEYISIEEHWQPYAFADPSRNYTRNLVDKGNGKSNLLVIVWNPGKGSPIHDHANAHCVMKVLKGRLQEELFTAPSSKKSLQTDSPAQPCDEQTEHLMAPSPICTTIYHENQVSYISDQIGLHKVTNPFQEVAVSLHLYTPPHAAVYGFNIFDDKTGRKMHMKQANVFSIRGKKMNPAPTSSE